MQPTEEFYDAWASMQLLDKSRDTVLKWKAANFLNLLLRNDFNQFESACEIGGAEGILLNTLDQVITIKSLHNYDISNTFCIAGKNLFPKIDFINQDFNRSPSFYDLVLLSDIIEHIENDDEFLHTVSKFSNYLLIKVPIEKVVINSQFFHAITLRRKPLRFKYGLTHINGHLRGYAISDIKKTLSKYFQIIDYEVSDVAYFNKSKKKKIVKKMLGKQVFIRTFGGAYFALCKSLIKK